MLCHVKIILYAARILFPILSFSFCFCETFYTAHINVIMILIMLKIHWKWIEDRCKQKSTLFRALIMFSTEIHLMKHMLLPPDTCLYEFTSQHWLNFRSTKYQKRVAGCYQVSVFLLADVFITSSWGFFWAAQADVDPDVAPYISYSCFSTLV